ncbi:MAG: GGDEF domain-containing protein [Ruminococcaceae bacterium]|nr:GGDEF domain-containing protein [Oscillospiraceae bacterium]
MKTKMKSLRRSVTVACAVFIGLLVATISVVTSEIISSSLYERFQRQMTSIVDYAESYIDDEDMAECARTYTETERYRETQAVFDRFIDYYKSLHYLYIIKTTEPGDEVSIRNICDATTTYDKTYVPDDVLHLGDGSAHWYSDESVQKLREIQAGDVDVFFDNPSEWGLDYTLARPLITASGEHYAVLCADISIDVIHSTINRNIYISIILIVVLGLLFYIASVLWLRTRITDPIRKLENSVTEFAALSHGKRDPDELVYRMADIRTNDEIQHLNNAIAKMADDMKDYVQNTVTAEEKVQDMRGLVETDPLTGVKSESGFIKMLGKLNHMIDEKNAEFAILVAELDKMQEINLKYGFDKCNTYVIGTCAIICDTYRHSPVYRVGGNRFVALLQEKDYRDRDALLKNVRQEMDKAATRLDSGSPWFRYSAEFGMAVYQPGEDKSANDVFKRATSELRRQQDRV